ncbi:MAG TPA: cyclodeaminase/cyclohydrolase family protein [Selenomonadales bacterium]|nr:cyclodeaminase/cyclohydrolase family protein [Selenomonadales bacterium]
MLINMTLKDFLAEAASATPAPGGGSVSALVGALGAALTSMVCELTTEKDADPAALAQVAQTKTEVLALMDSLQQAVDRDTQVFNKVMDAYRMPKATDAEKQVRSAAIQNSLKEAADEPCGAAALCLEVMKKASAMLRIGNRNAASDAAVAGLLAHAALHGALYNVKINIGAVKDADYTDRMKRRIDALTAESDQLLASLKALAAEVIG